MLLIVANCVRNSNLNYTTVENPKRFLHSSSSSAPKTLNQIISMATKQDSPIEIHEIITESEGSDPYSECDDSEEDPDFDMLEETHRSFSNLSLKNKAKKR